MPVPGTSKVPRYHEPVGCSGRWPLRCLPLRCLPLRCLPACRYAACRCAPCRCAACHCAGASERRGPWNGVQLRRRARLVEYNCAKRTPRPSTRRKRPARARPTTVDRAEKTDAARRYLVRGDKNQFGKAVAVEIDHRDIAHHAHL